MPRTTKPLSSSSESTDRLRPAARMLRALRSTSTAELIDRLGRWLDVRFAERRYWIYAVSNADDEKTVRQSLTTANEDLKRLPAQTKSVLSTIVGLPAVVADLVLTYEPVDFYEGFYWYRTTTDLPPVRIPGLGITSAVDESDPNIVRPTTIDVSRDLSDCLNITKAYKHPIPVIVIVPQSKVIDMMANAALPTLIRTATSAFVDGLYADRKSDFITRVLAADVHVRRWIDAMQNGDLQSLLQTQIGKTTYNLTPTGRTAVRRFVETVVDSYTDGFLDCRLDQFLLSVAPDAAYELASYLLRPPTPLVWSTKIRPVRAGGFVLPFFRHRVVDCLMPKPDDESKWRLLDAFVTYLRTCGLPATEIRCIRMIGDLYDTCLSDKSAAVGLSTIDGFYRTRMLEADFDEVIGICCDAVGFRIQDGASAHLMTMLQIMEVGYNRFRSDVRTRSTADERKLTVVGDWLAIYYAFVGGSSSSSAVVADTKQETVDVSGIDPDDDGNGGDNKRKSVETDAGSVSVSATSTKRSKTNKTDDDD